MLLFFFASRNLTYHKLNKSTYLHFIYYRLLPVLLYYFFRHFMCVYCYVVHQYEKALTDLKAKKYIKNEKLKKMKLKDKIYMKSLKTY